MKLSLILLLISLVSCTTLKTHDRDPSSEEGIFSAEARYEYYLNQIPADQMISHSLDIPSYSKMKEACPRYAEISSAERFSVLVPKLNQPFRFVVADSNDGSIRFVGNAEEMKEFFCLMLAMGESETAAGLEKTDRSSFILQVAQMPNTNFKAMEVMIGTWQGKRTSLVAAQSIIRHRLFDVYTAKEMLGGLYRSDNNRGEKIQILQELIQTPEYKERSSELSVIFFRENTNFVTVQERIAITELFLNQKQGHDVEAMVNFLLAQADPSVDYFTIYPKLAQGKSVASQFDLFSKMQAAGARMSNSDQIVLSFWQQGKEMPVYDNIARFVVDDISTAKILSKETHLKIIIDRLAKPPYSDKFVAAVLREIFNTEKFNTQQRLNIMNGISKNDLADLETVRLYLGGLISILAEGSTTGAEFADSAIRAAKKFTENDEIINMFSKFVLKTQDTKYRYALIVKVLPIFSFSESSLRTMLYGIKDFDDATKYSVVEKVLAQSKITDKVLEDAADTIRSSFRVSDADKKILNLILKHPKMSPQLATQIKKKLNPVLEYVQDPSGH